MGNEASGRNTAGELPAEHDQDSDPPRTAVPPGRSTRNIKAPAEHDPTHDQDSDPPRTAVPPDSEA
jgi:hypothetical protein